MSLTYICEKACARYVELKQAICELDVLNMSDLCDMALELTSHAAYLYSSFHLGDAMFIPSSSLHVSCSVV